MTDFLYLSRSVRDKNNIKAIQGVDISISCGTRLGNEAVLWYNTEPRCLAIHRRPLRRVGGRKRGYVTRGVWDLSNVFRDFCVRNFPSFVCYSLVFLSTLCNCLHCSERIREHNFGDWNKLQFDTNDYGV